MSIDAAVKSILAASQKLSPAAIPVMEAWLREQSQGCARRIVHDDLHDWFSSLHPSNVKSEHDLTLAQANYLAWLLP